MKLQVGQGGGGGGQTNREGGEPELVTTHQPPLWTEARQGKLRCGRRQRQMERERERVREGALFEQGGVWKQANKDEKKKEKKCLLSLKNSFSICFRL